MYNLLSRVASPFYIDLPFHLSSWIGWGLFLAAIAAAAWHWREPVNLRRWPRWLILLILSGAVPLTVLFLGMKLPGATTLPLPLLPIERSQPALMFFAALPWVLAGGILGVIPATLLGAAAGLLIGLVESHSLFTLLEVAALALLFSAAVRQRYRTPLYRILRHPLAAAAVVTLISVPLFMLGGFFEVNGPLAVRIDYGITQTWVAVLARGGELLIASLFAEILLLFKSPFWQRPALLLPSPAETNLQTRFFFTTLPLALALMFTLVVADWIVAGNAARRMVRDRLSSTAQVAADSLPYFMEAGQNLILNLATPDLISLSTTSLPGELANRMRAIPYFRQLYLIDAQGQPVGGYPLQGFNQLLPTGEELTGIDLALKGVLIQSYIIPPLMSETTAQVSFLALIHNSSGQPAGVLIGRTDLNSNPFTQPAIQALETVRKMGGEGVLLDETNRILYNPVPSLVMTGYIGRVPRQSEFFDENSPTGTRRLVFGQPVLGRDWTVMLSVPALQAQEIALQIAVPLLVILFIVTMMIFLVLRLSLRGMGKSLQALETEATRISQGELSYPLHITGEDEVGRLGSAFETMRLGLKARLEELNRLLLVSQGVASSLEIRDAARPILEAALCDGASMARVVLLREVALDTQGGQLTSFGLGSRAEAYAFVDEQIFELMRTQEFITIANTSRMRRLNLPAGRPHPLAVMARALYHENAYYGVLWVAYDQPHPFTNEEIRFFTTLSAQAVLAAANARLYATAEVGRQRMEAVLSSTPEPVLVTDAQNRLLLLNPAALHLPGLVISPTPGKPINEVVPVPGLLDLLSLPFDERVSSQELALPNGRVYYVSVSPVMAEGRPVGKVCILRDITHYKELDALKSDFVATVSHDLRSPLTLMRGYATMLQMVGDLNEQQKSYLRKINLGVDNMTRLVNNLLDLGRIEAGIDLQLEKVAVSEVVEQVLVTLQPQAIQKNISLTQELPGPGQPATVEADAALLQQAFYNLIENAVKYTSVGGQVKVRVQARSSGILFEVHDSGIGIAPLDLPRLFEKFFRSGRREAYQQRGTGLGLAIVKSIAERHGGKVWVESTLGKGSSFFMEIPFLQEPAAQTVFS